MAKAITLLLLLALAHPPAWAAQGDGALRLVTKEESLGNLETGSDLGSLTTDPGFQHVAYIVKRGAKESVVVDDKAGKEHDAIVENRELYFSPDGQRFAYVAKHGNKRLVVVDGKEGKEYDHICEYGNPIFSPDSKQVAYVATIDNQLIEKLRIFGAWPLEDFVVVNGQKKKTYAMVEDLVFSPDGQKLAYLGFAHWNGISSVVVNEIEGKPYGESVGVVFSPDSSRLAFTAHKRVKHKVGTYFAVIDGKEGHDYTSVGSIIFSPDSKHTAYIARSSQSFVIRDDVPGDRYNSLQGLPVFSPDSQRLAYVALQGTNWVMIVNDKVFDDQQVEQYTAGLTFSPDSQHLAYRSRIGTNWFTVVDGVVEKSSEHTLSDPVFSPDSKWLAYLVRRNGKSIPVYGDLTGGEYDRFVTCDPLLNTTAMPQRTPFALDRDGVLHAIVLRGNEILRLELSIAR